MQLFREMGSRFKNVVVEIWQTGDEQIDGRVSTMKLFLKDQVESKIEDSRDEFDLIRPTPIRFRSKSDRVLFRNFSGVLLFSRLIRSRNDFPVKSPSHLSLLFTTSCFLLILVALDI